MKKYIYTQKLETEYGMLYIESGQHLYEELCLFHKGAPGSPQNASGSNDLAESSL